ncbi:MAG TPA: hypothetical protein VFA60_02220 [Terriglobales bacterium]|nr:hypothetical protein [Terriglobales bacterium]
MGRRVRLAFRAAALVIAGLQAWIGRHDVMLDGISYLDIARAAANGNVSALANSYWSPGYPALTAVVLRLFHPPLLSIFVVPRALNFVLYFALLAAFEFFWRELGRLRPPRDGFPDWAWHVFGYSLFLWMSLWCMGTWFVEANILMEVFLLLSAALMLKVRRTMRLADGALWGVAMAAGYLAKAPMFPATFVMLAVVLLGARRTIRRVLPRLAVAALVFAAISLPWAAALHARYHRWTFGDSAALNYAWYINGVRIWFHWQGGPPASGVPAHPPRQLAAQPETFEYASPVPGTLPIWDDPAYWYEGVRPHFDLRQQLETLVFNTRDMLPRSQVGIVAAFLLLVVFAVRERRLRAIFAGAWPVWIVGAAGVGMFAIVHVEGRHIAGFLLLLWSGLFAGVRLGPSENSRRVLIAAVVIAALSFNALAIASVARTRRLTAASDQRWSLTQRMPAALQRARIAPGDPVVSLGGELYYWALPAGVRIVADISADGVPAWWKLAPQERDELIAKFRACGARVIVAGPGALHVGRLARADLGQWEPLGDTGFFVFRLN